jgi:hypothetical protein
MAAPHAFAVGYEVIAIGIGFSQNSRSALFTGIAAINRLLQQYLPGDALYPSRIDIGQSRNTVDQETLRCIRD